MTREGPGINLLRALNRDEALQVYSRLGLRDPIRFARHLSFRCPHRSTRVLLPDGEEIRVDTLIDNLEYGGFTAAEFFRVLAEVRRARS
jgi:hypothetical protein